MIEKDAGCGEMIELKDQERDSLLARLADGDVCDRLCLMLFDRYLK